MYSKYAIFLLFSLIGTTFISGCKSLPTNKDQKQVTRLTITWEGYERSYLIHLPPNEKRHGPLPILFHLHGGGGTAKGTPGLTFGRFNELADRDGFIVVYPQAIEKNWNDGRKSDQVTAWKKNIDDVGFIVAIIEELKQKYNIDASRIFTAGMSNGGFMSSRLLCDRADLFRGGAILTASISLDYLPKCQPSQSTAVMIMNGTDDPLIPYNGGKIKVFKKDRGRVISTDDYVKFWQKQNGCANKMATVHLPDKKDDGTSVSIEEYTNCENSGALVLYKITGGGHTWPGGKQYLRERWIGKTSKEIMACDVIWDFFKSL